MEVILLEKVSKLGNAGAVVNVKPGYARNFLIPTSKALRATEENKQFFEEKRKEFEAENKKKIEDAKKQVSSVEGKFVVLIRQAGEDGRLFGSVSSKDITDALNKAYNLEIKRSHIVLTTPVKYLGIHEIDVSFHAEVSTKIKLNVARTESEAEEAKKNHLKPAPKVAEVSEEKVFKKKAVKSAEVEAEEVESE